MRNAPRLTLALVLTLLLAACGQTAESQTTPAPAPGKGRQLAKATFAGGCFWCMEPPFDKLPGVVSTTSGYTGGRVTSPSYEQVSAGGTGHTEAVQILYDPAKVSYRQLVDVYWKNIDPFDASGQFCDKGSQYRSEVFFHDEEQRRVAEETKAALEKQLGRPFATAITKAAAFWPAEEYHQNYYEKNPVRYKFYRNGCGRDRRLQEVWGSASGR